MKIKNLSLLASFALLFSNCYEPVQGCLDIAATNFQATADENCCCKYPTLIFTVDQYWDTLVYRNDSKFQLPSGEKLKFFAISFYLSDFQFFKNGVASEVSDTAHLSTFPDGESKIFKNDFQLIRRSPAQYQIGEFLPDGEFQKLSFRLGLNDSANLVQPKLAPTNHPLREQPENLWASETEGFRFLMLAFSRDTNAVAATDTIYFLKKDLPAAPLEFSGKYLHALGYNFSMKMKVDYRTWFAGVNLSTDDNQVVKSKIVANLHGSFSVSQ